jgi:hypothetical protein
MIKRFPNFLNNNECLKVIESHNDYYFQNHDALTNESKSSFHFFNKKEYNIFLEDLNLNLNFQDKLFKHIPFQCKISNIWLNKQIKNSTLITHDHAHSVLSGILYLKIDENSSGTTFFYEDKKLTIIPQCGLLLIFPSWLKHGGSSVNLSEERIVLSFNIQAH